MTTAVALMDRDEWNANTDVIVVVQPRQRRLLWVPRDVFCPQFGGRVNSAYAHGGHSLLRSALAELGIAVDHSVCLRRGAVERALEGVTVTVPVSEPLRFWYPLAPDRRIEDGRKPVDFDPPEAKLEGESIHQWIGARTSRDRPTSDLERIGRQQVFLAALFRSGYDFSEVLRDDTGVRLSGRGALRDLRKVRPSWRMQRVDGFVPHTIDEKRVLVLITPPQPPK